jgi:hypothetical protein
VNAGGLGGKKTVGTTTVGTISNTTSPRGDQQQRAAPRTPRARNVGVSCTAVAGGGWLAMGDV